MSDVKCAGAMLQAAERDLATLRHMGPGAPEESFGFHLQQAAEKTLKAWIALLGERYPLTHGIDTLLERLRDLAVDTTPFDRLDAFTPYAVTFRYEGVQPGSEPIDRAGMIALTTMLVHQVRRNLVAVDGLHPDRAER